MRQIGFGGGTIKICPPLDINEEALRERLSPKLRVARKFKLRLLTKSGRIIPGTNLADRDLLYEKMEGRV